MKRIDIRILTADGARLFATDAAFRSLHVAWAWENSRDNACATENRAEDMDGPILYLTTPIVFR